MLPKDLESIPEDEAGRERWFDENLAEVTFTPRMALRGVAADEPLRRYIDLPKLFDLIVTRSLLMPRLRQLMNGDPFECIAQKVFTGLTPTELRKRAKSLELYAPRDNLSLRQRPLTLFDPFAPSLSPFDFDLEDMSVDELAKAISYLERERLKNSLVCSCWHRGTAESDAMWRIYASQLGVAIISSTARMASAFQLTVPKIYRSTTALTLASVNYIDVEQCEEIEPWLIKRRAFEHEQEVRLYSDVPYAFGREFRLRTDVRALIQEIVITPFATEWQLEGIMAAIKALLAQVGVTDIKVRQSQHMSAPEMKWPPAAKAQAAAFQEFVRAMDAVSSIE